MRQVRPGCTPGWVCPGEVHPGLGASSGGAPGAGSVQGRCTPGGWVCPGEVHPGLGLSRGGAPGAGSVQGWCTLGWVCPGEVHPRLGLCTCDPTPVSILTPDLIQGVGPSRDRSIQGGLHSMCLVGWVGMFGKPARLLQIKGNIWKRGASQKDPLTPSTVPVTRQTDRQTERDRERQRETQRHRDTETQRHRARQR